MPTRDQIFTTIFGWIKAETGWTVIKDPQKETRPARPYVSVRFLNPSERLGGSVDQQRSVNSGGTWKVTAEGMRKSLVSINAFGPGAVDKLSALRDSLDRADIIELFSGSDIGHLGEGPVNDLTTLLETEYEERAQWDLYLSFAAYSEVDVGTIEHVRLTGTANDKTVNVNTDSP